MHFVKNIFVVKFFKSFIFLFIFCIPLALQFFVLLGYLYIQKG